jgi:hypothetical protein
VPLLVCVFVHVNDGEGRAVEEGNGEVLEGKVAFGGEELRSGEGCAHFEASEAGGSGGVFAGL